MAQNRVSLKGPAAVFVTTTVNKWIPLFAESRIAEVLLVQMRETLNRYQIATIAYVLMPSHLHAIFGFPEIEGLSEVKQKLKGHSAHQIRPLLTPAQLMLFSVNGRFALWMRRFDDLIIWSDTQFKIKAEYIHNNPVKAGIVNSATEYQYSSAQDWLLGTPGIFPIDKTWKWQSE